LFNTFAYSTVRINVRIHGAVRARQATAIANIQRRYQAV